MHLIVCLDARDGMLFNCRRQSSDRQLRERMLERVGESRLWMNSYSARQFEEKAPITVDEDFLQKAGEDDFCFVENVDIGPAAEAVKSITVYRWDKVYPSDTAFPWVLFPSRQLWEAADFVGHSHAMIVEERYRL